MTYTNVSYSYYIAFVHMCLLLCDTACAPPSMTEAVQFSRDSVFPILCSKSVSL